MPSLSDAFSAVKSIFNPEDRNKQMEEEQKLEAEKKLNNTINAARTQYNPFINQQTGKLVNPFINYQKMLDSNRVNDKVKDFVYRATGLTPSQPQVTTTAASTTPAAKGDIAANAQKYMGTPYVWGGESMEEGGMDCSGFVYNALKDSGYDVGRTTAQGYRGYGTVVSKADLQPGDLVFYGSQNNATHIGIYIGNGNIIHSAGGSKNTKSNPGKGVSIVPLNHRKDFVEARRY